MLFSILTNRKLQQQINNGIQIIPYNAIRPNIKRNKVYLRI